MLYYAKITEIKDKEDLLDLFDNQGAAEHEIVLDQSVAQKAPGSAYQCLKDRLLSEDQDLCIDTIFSLGKNNREISKELQWFYENKVPLLILDIPSTADEAVSPLVVLSELYERLAAVEIRNVKTNQRRGIERGRAENKPLGRKRIPYPPGWGGYYQKWQRKEITTTEFMKWTRLKKGTFYNLVKQYKERIAMGKEA